MADFDDSGTEAASINYLAEYRDRIDGWLVALGLDPSTDAESEDFIADLDEGADDNTLLNSAMVDILVYRYTNDPAFDMPTDSDVESVVEGGSLNEPLPRANVPDMSANI